MTSCVRHYMTASQHWNGLGSDERAEMTSIDNSPTLVTGATGFIGNNLVRQLVEQGRTVRVLVRTPNKMSLRGLDVETVVGDVLDPECLREAMSGVSSVFHVVGAISIEGEQNDRLHQVNVDGTSNVVDACISENVKRLVHFSSVHALSYLPKNLPIAESRALALDPDKHLPYDRSKAEGELAVMAGIQKGMNAVILNPVGVFGPYDFGPSPSGEFLLQLMNRKLPGIVKAGYFWVDVRDVANAAILAESKGVCGERYILSGEYVDFDSIANWVEEATSVRRPWLSVPLRVAKMMAPFVVAYSRWRGLRPLVTPEALQIVECHQKIETQKAALELGFSARPIRETIFDSVRWLKENLDEQH